jgi:SAM-dependent methyltransferase
MLAACASVLREPAIIATWTDKLDSGVPGRAAGLLSKVGRKWTARRTTNMHQEPSSHPEGPLPRPVKGPAQWNLRFAEPGFAYGDAPNVFLASAVAGLPSGQTLSLAEGEGRNAVYLAGLGHRVTAVDFSAVGREKALDLARRRGVALSYRLTDLAELELGTECWDLVVAVFSQPAGPVRRRLYGSLCRALRPGGCFVLESKVEQGEGADGRYPGVDSLCAELAGLDVLLRDEADRDLSEGRFHVGTHRTARIVARRPGGREVAL